MFPIRILSRHKFQLHQLSITSPSVVPHEQDLALAQQFFDGGSSVAPIRHVNFPQLTDLSKLELREKWVLDQPHHLPAHEISAVNVAWAAEFANVSQRNSSGSVVQQNSIPTTRSRGFP